MLVGYTASLLALLLLVLAVSPKYKTSLMFDIGAILMTFSMLAIAVDVFDDQICDAKAAAVRFVVGAVGLLLMLGDYIRKRS